MAFDEALLEAASRLAKPVLRFYGWAEPAASFGYFQKYEEVAQLTRLRPLVRRPTGGGLVSHATDWTYSLTFPPGHWWRALRAMESYQRVHEWIRDAFAKFNVATELSPSCRKDLPGQCFLGAEKFDLLWRGKKVAGAAQRRNRLGLLIQGSVQPPPVSLARADWQKVMCEVAVEKWNITWSPFGLELDLGRRAEELARGKFFSAEYSQQR
jgi:lipoate-protein ligase A